MGVYAQWEPKLIRILVGGILVGRSLGGIIIWLMVTGGFELRMGKSRVNKAQLNVYLIKLSGLYTKNASILKYIEHLNFFFYYLYRQI